ncbi:MAG: MBL fold metallo-hydrolase [Capsulimonadales bacterium]|nr:MBL fold metallo-hydrolase [Capsulimonadales bacterium]
MEFTESNSKIKNPAAPTFTVRFWGVRGSIPSPGPHTVRYGGNTSCVSVEGNYSDGTPTVGIFDAGTGIRLLGDELINGHQDILLLLTHTHWDHIQGFPFFAPLRQQDRNIYLSRNEREHGLFQLLLDQMDGTRFPIRLDALRSRLLTHTPERIAEHEAKGYRIRRIRVNHPGETYGFRAELPVCHIVYIPDNEVSPPENRQVSFEELTEFCREADVLIHDAQFTEADMPGKWGWGHSLVSQVRELARAARVRHLVLFHHDPDRTDDELDAIQAECNRWFAENAPDIRCTVAYEGLTLRLPE